MSNVYIQEPPTHGKVLLETTAGDIDIELWSRECPKACRNFIQLCMEGYYEKTIFHRLVKGFIVQGGDPTGTGQGGNSIWGKPFKDEIHSRLRFVRRGLVGMANAGKDDNGSQFFFTLAATPELDKKHTLFGKVTGDTVYNMLKLEEGETDQEEKPVFPYKIIRTKILLNPFEDIVPRESVSSRRDKDRSDKSKAKSKEQGTKNYKLLSFGEEAEEEEEEVAVVVKKWTGKSKSSHDLTNDPKLSSEVAVTPSKSSSSSSNKSRKRKHNDIDNENQTRTESIKSSSSSSNSEADSGSDSEKEEKLETAKRVKSIQEKLKSKSNLKEPTNFKKKERKEEKEEENDDSYYLGKDEDEAKKRRVLDLKAEFRELKSGMRRTEEEKLKKKEEEEVKRAKEEQEEKRRKENDLIEDFLEKQKEYKTKTKDSKKKGADREAATLALLQKFQKKLEAVKETVEETGGGGGDRDQEKEEEEEDPLWLAKSLDYEGDELVLAKDANLKTEDWYALDDPRNPVVQRRRHEAKRQADANRPKRRDLI